MPTDLKAGRLGLSDLLRLGWRNLARNRKRTLITLTTVTVAVLLLEFSMALMTGIERQSFDNLINYQTAHAKAYAHGYFEERLELPLDITLSDVDDLRGQIEGIRGVIATTPRLSFSIQLSDGIDQLQAEGIGIDVSGSDDDVFRIPQTVVAGRYLEPGDEGMLLGSGLADLYGVGAGDWLTVLTKTVEGAYEALDLPIVGVIGTGNPRIDQGSALLPLDVAQHMVDLEQQATELAVRFAPTASQRVVLRRLKETLASTGIEVKGWREIEEDFMALTTMKRTGQAVILSIFVVLALVGITNTMLMATFERTREIGMLMAMGLRERSIRTLFLLEGAMTGFLGGLLGVALAAVVVLGLLRNGIDFSSMFGDMDIGYPIRGRMYAALTLPAIGWSLLFTGLMAALAALYPAVKASREDPAEALRHV